MDTDKRERVAVAAQRALAQRNTASLGDVLAQMGRAPVERAEARGVLQSLVADGVLERIGADLYAPARGAASRLPGRSYVTDLMRLGVGQLMVARA